jgi:hypothetical protein
MPRQQPYPRVYTHRRHFGPRVAHCPEATQTSASSVLPSPLPTRMSLHHLTPSHIPHMSSLLLDVQRLSSGVSQASGMGHQAGLVLSLFPHPYPNIYIPHPPTLACRRRPLDTGKLEHHRHPRYVALWSTVRAQPTTRPLPRPAAIASRHATSRAMQVTSALLLSQAAPAALFSPHSPCLSLVHASPHARPYTATDTQRGRRGMQTPERQASPSG